ncbi:hypothetical protein HTV80_12335 [Streptomyces sp. Vc74B-19]|uniref:hypothetical protein n=1 Tax=unclassified Streptomyces TaxID=2593676 RepID=UPI001BFBF7BE|nr:MULTISPECIES: hypothetical protein [unclassified Streptomyces]MBT3163896.1 hypothetical protein [Streptomyces sp. Vc74B-19]MCO4696323.1 hypothetical protein [Streptomyces sp. RO-S4]MDU0305077.1 hypothetical protein [Streptomyces sp. PAL114]
MRTHLPQTVEPGVDYRDVTVHYQLETGLKEPPSTKDRDGPVRDGTAPAPDHVP